MYFNSYAYIFLFLPVSVIGYFVVAKYWNMKASNCWLVVASLFFYGYWNISYLPILAGSILCNYALARGILYAQMHENFLLKAKYIFVLGVSFDIGILVYYKYMDFFIKNFNRLMGTSLELWNVILPLGISFFSITQMVYLIGVYFYGDGRKFKDFTDYCLFVSFFPHLLAGPILYHKKMMKQFADESLHSPQAENIARGIAIFVIGLFKKVIIADALLGPIGEGFAHASEIGFYEGSIDENTPANPQSLYGIAKNALRQGITVLQKSHSFLLQWIRGFYIVGNVERGSSIFSKLAQAEKRGEKTFPFTMGTNQFDFIDYDEFCKQVTAVVMQERVNGIINCCSGNPMRLGERVEQFLAENHFQIKLQYGAFPDRLYDSKAVWGDSRKIEAIMKGGTKDGTNNS